MEVVKPPIIKEFEKICASLVEEFDETKGHQLALRDWSFLSNYITKFIDEAKKIPDLLEEISEQPTLGERISTIVSVNRLRGLMEVACDEMITACEVKDLKNVSLAQIYCVLGLKFFDLEKFDKAAEQFNMGLLVCPQPKDIARHKTMRIRNMFAMILANRCRVFSITYRYEQSLADLDAAIKYAVCPKFIRGLFDAREILIAEIRENCVDNSIYDPMSMVTADAFLNPDISGAAAALQMVYRSKLGRHIIARAPISKNVRIISEKAYSHWLAPSYYSIYCAHCMKNLNEQPFPCRFCIYFRFCNEECYEEAWKEYHSIECRYMPVLKYFANGHLALRMILTNGVEDSLDAYYEVMAKQKFPVEARMVYRSRMKDILTLISHEDLVDKFMNTGTFTAAFLTIFCRSLGLIDDELVEDFGGLILKLLSIIRINSLLISDNTKREEEQDDFASPRYNRSEIGAGLFGASSFINHSCDNNCNKIFEGNRMIISTRRNIEAGEEITITYGPSKDRYGYKERQAMIMRRHFFKCACPACVARI